MKQLSRINLSDMIIISLNRVDLLTLSGMFLACCAGVLALNQQFAFSLCFLFLALLADAFDGILARKYNIERNFGRYLDGFVDVFDYLVVPSLFLYMWGFNTWYYCLTLSVFMMCGIIRLSVFNETGNIGDGETLSYLGMPVFWSALFLGMIYILSWFTGKTALFPVIALSLSAFSFFMIWNRPFYKFKNPKTIFMAVASCTALFFLKGSFDTFPSGPLPHIVSALYLMLPVIIGGSLHMTAVKKNWFPFLKIPVNTGWFGKNKTLRGFILMPLFTISGAFLFQSIPAYCPLSADFSRFGFAYTGFVLGLSYVLAELPNSWIKRRMGVAPGELPEKHRLLFMMADQLDSAAGAAVAAVLFLDTPVLTALTLIVTAPAVALAVKRILYILKLKESYA